MTAPTLLHDLDADLPEAIRPPGITVGIELGAWYVPVTVYPDGTTELGIARREHEEVLAALRDLRLATSDRSCIKVWPFNQAPPEFQSLSPHGGDEDWLALIPPDMSIPYWMDSGGSFGICDTSIHDIADGFTVCIGAHA